MTAAAPSLPASRAARVAWYASFSLLAAVVAVVLLVDSASISGRDALYPRAILVVVLALALLAAVREVRAAGRTEAVDEIEGGRGVGVAWSRTAAVAAALAAMPVLLPTAGYIVGIGLLALVVTIALGRRSWLGVIACALGISLGSYAIFVLGLGARIPGGAVLP